MVEPNRLIVKNVELSIGRLPEAFEGISVAQISDIHFAEFLGADHLSDVVRQTNALRPDIVAFTGDLATRPGRDDSKIDKPAARKAVPAGPILADLSAPLGRYAVLGNHDLTTDPGLMSEVLNQHGFKVLRNQTFPIERDGHRIWIAGIDDCLHGRGDVVGTLASIPNREQAIVLVHEPDMADMVAKHPVDVQLSGHSHGGQVRIPLIGAPILPKLARKYPLGSYRIRNLQLYTNPGVGVVGLPLRFDCPPEITLFTLRRDG